MTADAGQDVVPSAPQVPAERPLGRVPHFIPAAHPTGDVTPVPHPNGSTPKAEVLRTKRILNLFKTEDRKKQPNKKSDVFSCE